MSQGRKRSGKPWRRGDGGTWKGSVPLSWQKRYGKKTEVVAPSSATEEEATDLYRDWMKQFNEGAMQKGRAYTWDELIEAFRTRPRGKASAATYRWYNDMLGPLEAFIDTNRLGDVRLDGGFTASRINEFMDEHYQKREHLKRKRLPAARTSAARDRIEREIHLEKSRAFNKRRLVSYIINWAKQSNLIALSSNFKLTSAEQPSGSLRHYILPDDSIQDLFEAADKIDTAWLRDLLAFTLLTGLRPGESLSVLFEHYDAADKTLYVPKFKEKSKRDHKIPLCHEACEIIERRADGPSETYVFHSSTGHTLVGNGVYERAMDDIKDLGNEKVTHYTLRHTYATRMVEAGVDVFLLARLMGTSVLMIEKYYAKPDLDVLATATSLNPLRSLGSGKLTVVALERQFEETDDSPVSSWASQSEST